MSFILPVFSAIGGALGGAGSLLSAGASILGGISAMGAANYQAAVANNNARIAEANAQIAQEQAFREQEQSDAQAAAFIGEQLSKQGASGLDVGGRSQLLTRKQAAVMGRQDALNIREAGAYKVQNYMQEAENQRAEAGAAKASGISSMIGGVLGAGSSLIGGASTTKTANRITAVRRDPWYDGSLSLRRRTIG